MAGRKPIPTNLHVLRGNPGKRPLFMRAIAQHIRDNILDRQIAESAGL